MFYKARSLIGMPPRDDVAWCLTNVTQFRFIGLGEKIKYVSLILAFIRKDAIEESLEGITMTYEQLPHAVPMYKR